MRKEKVAGAEATSSVSVDEEGSFGVIEEYKERNIIFVEQNEIV